MRQTTHAKLTVDLPPLQFPPFVIQKYAAFDRIAYFHTLAYAYLLKMESKVLQPKLFKLLENKHNKKVYQIDPIVIPYLFNFSSRVLNSCKLSDQITTSNPVVSEMFDYLKEKILPKRKFSKTGRMPTRMKAQEKIKFIMRCLQNNLAKIYNRPAAKLTIFNVQEQKAFFNREDVRKHFLEEIPRILEEKQRQNQQKIKEIEALIKDVINESKKSQKQAKKIFELDIKQRQLPWSVDMFTDIKFFCKDIYRDFIQKSKNTNQQSSKQKCNTQQLQNINELDQIQLDGEQWFQESMLSSKTKKKDEDANQSESTN